LLIAAGSFICMIVEFSGIVVHLHARRLAEPATMDFQEQLLSLANSMKRSRDMLQQLDQHTLGWKHGIRVESLSAEAQKELEALFGLSDAARRRIVQHQLRRCLAFSDMHERFEVVDQAHFDTFRWLLEDDVENQSSSIPEVRYKYLHWLSSGTGIFHIAGKLGSGKSTLKKFICRHPSTTARLLSWAGGWPLLRQLNHVN
jgi:hypothetical protein